MKLDTALDKLHDCRITSLGKFSHGYVVYEITAQNLMKMVAKRLTRQRALLTILLAASIGYGVMITWIASELVHENQALTLELNATQTALHIAQSPYFIQHSPHCSDSMLF